MSNIISYKIAILGPESTGKSHLAHKLSAYFNGMCVPEIARDYLKEIQLNYTYEDILTIAKLQEEEELKIELNTLNPNQLILCDTEWITIKIWLEYYNYEVPQWLIEGIENAEYVHYLLTDIDLPWRPDPLRQNELDRDDIFDLFEADLKRFYKPYSIVRGQGYKRLQNAVNIISDL